MQSIHSILGDEATFVEIFNEATHNDHQFGGYPNEQYTLYIRHGDEWMANKWSSEVLPSVEGIVNVWSEMKQLAWIAAMKANVKSHTVMPCPTGNQWCNKSNPCTNCRMGNYYGE